MNNRIRTRKPVHPGIALKADVLDPLGLSLTEASRQMAVDAALLQAFIGGNVPCDVGLAGSIAAMTGTTPESWQAMQASHDLHSTTCK
jgi:addiction module HigA family antidote